MNFQLPIGHACAREHAKVVSALEEYEAARQDVESRLGESAAALAALQSEHAKVASALEEEQRQQGSVTGELCGNTVADSSATLLPKSCRRGEDEIAACVAAGLFSLRAALGGVRRRERRTGRTTCATRVFA